MSKKTLDHLLILFTILCDLCFIGTAIVIAYWVRFETGWLDAIAVHKGGTPPFEDYLRLIPVTVVIWIMILQGFKLYHPENSATFFTFWKLLKASIFALIATLAILFFLYHNEAYSRWVMLLATGFNIVSLYLVRVVILRFRQAIQSQGVGVNRIALVGYDERGKQLMDTIKTKSDTAYNLVGIIGNSEIIDLCENGDISIQHLGKIDEILDIIQDHRIDTLFIASPTVPNNTILNILHTCEGIPVQINLLPELSDFIKGGSSVTFFDSIPVLQLSEIPMQGVSGIIKRIIDIVFSTFALIVLSPLMLILAIIIRLDSPGKAIFRQERVSKAGKPFNIYKFRSMHADAEYNIGHVWAKTDDPRQTVLGRFLRRWSLDELPQFFNVLKGDMSLVGPRPEMSGLIDTFQESIPHYLARHRVKSGMTGWAQVNGLRGNTSLEDRINYDRFYIENWSLALDLKIIFRTLWAIKKG